MEKPSYLSELELVEALSHISRPRPRYCCGFKIKCYSLIKQLPKAFLHFDEDTKLPLAILCDHTSCNEASEAIFMLISLYASGVISDQVWLELFPYRWRKCSGHPVIPRVGPRPIDKLCPGYKLDQKNVENPAHESSLQYGRDIDIDTMRPYTVNCAHGNSECQPFAPFWYALLSIYAKGLIKDLRPHYNSMCPKFLIHNYGWRSILNKSADYKDVFTKVVFHPATILKPSLSGLLFNTSCLVKSIPIQRFEPEIMLPDLKINASDQKRHVYVDEMSETSCSDSDDDGHYNDFYVFKKQSMSKTDNSLTAQISFGDDPLMLLEKITPLSAYGGKMQIDKPSYKCERLTFNVKQDLPGLIQFLCKTVTETENSGLIAKAKHELRRGIDLISEPHLVFARRRREARELRKKWRLDLLKK